MDEGRWTREERRRRTMDEGGRFAVGGKRLEVGGKNIKPKTAEGERPQTSSEAILKPNAAKGE